jgi:AraC family transcriptional regulator, regulatory protein of adaptative response / methylated-DNA-[protein]-cysteine methyltransferase
MFDVQNAETRPDLATAHDPVADYGHVRRAIEFMTAHWQTQPELSEIADHLGLSPAYCQRLFKRWCGVSPKEFIQAITIDHARDLLDRSASVLDTTLEVGLSGPGRLHDLFLDHEGMTPGDYKRRGAGLTITYGYHPSRFGVALIMTTARGMCGLAFTDDDTGRDIAFADMERRWPRADYVEDATVTAPLAARIFADGARPEPATPPINVVLIGTDFQVRVWRALTTIPAGATVTYGAIASQIGQPTASRAVGAAIGANPISFVVPCHRAIGSTGALTGYHWGITRKRAIIGWERVRG